MWAAGALRGSPLSITATRRRARLSTRAADSPAALPPITMTSYSLRSFMPLGSVGAGPLATFVAKTGTSR